MGCERIGQRRHRATRDADDARRRPHRAHRLERFSRHDEHVRAIGGELFRERADGRIGERVLFERRALDRQPRLARLEQEMRAVEQQLAFVSVFMGVASELAIAFDAGVRCSSHLESITDVLGSSCG